MDPTQSRVPHCRRCLFQRCSSSSAMTVREKEVWVGILASGTTFDLSLSVFGMLFPHQSFKFSVANLSGQRRHEVR